MRIINFGTTYLLLDFFSFYFLFYFFIFYFFAGDWQEKEERSVEDGGCGWRDFYFLVNNWKDSKLKSEDGSRGILGRGGKKEPFFMQGIEMGMIQEG